MQNLSLSYFINLALKRLWILVLAAVVFAVSAFAYSKLVLVPTYSATASIIVTNGGIIFQDSGENQNEQESNKDTISSYDFSSSVVLARNVVELLKSPNKFIKLAERLGNNYSYSSLSSRATIQIRNDSTIFIDISFQSTNGTEAIKLANTFAELACEEIPSDIKNAEVSLVSSAPSYRLLSPNVFSNTIVSGVVGFILAYVSVFIVDILDQSIRGEEEFVERYDIPLLGSVPDFQSIVDSSSNKYGYSSKGGYFGGKY